MVSSITSSLLIDSGATGRRFRENRFALHKAFQARKIHVDIRTHVVGGNRSWKYRGQSLLEGTEALWRSDASFLRRGHLWVERNSSLCLLTCCSKSSNALFTAAAAVRLWPGLPSVRKASAG